MDFRAGPCRTTVQKCQPMLGPNAFQAVLDRPGARQGPTAHVAIRPDGRSPRLLYRAAGRPMAAPGRDADPADLRRHLAAGCAHRSNGDRLSAYLGVSTRPWCWWPVQPRRRGGGMEQPPD
jgi:hypothetical protein